MRVPFYLAKVNAFNSKPIIKLKTYMLNDCTVFFFNNNIRGYRPCPPRTQTDVEMARLPIRLRALVASILCRKINDTHVNATSNS